VNEKVSKRIHDMCVMFKIVITSERNKIAA
jgi:hypothetical protein